MRYEGFEYGDWHSFVASRKLTQEEILANDKFQIVNVYPGKINASIKNCEIGDIAFRFIHDKGNNVFNLRKNVYYPLTQIIPDFKYRLIFDRGSFTDISYIRFDGQKNIIHLRLLARPEWYVCRVWRFTFRVKWVPSFFVLRNERYGTRFFTCQAGPVRKVVNEEISVEL